MDAAVAIQALGGSLYLLTAVIVGCRLLLLALRSRALPELLLGAGLVLGGVIGGPLEAAGLGTKGEIGPEMAGRLLLIGKLFGVVALACQLGFIWRVFRPHERWAAGLAGALLAFSLAGLWGHAVNGSFASAEISVFWFCVELVGRLGAPCWLVFEGYRYYRLMSRRLRLGLADPVVTNRFLLWTLAGVCAIAMFLTSVPPIFLDPDRDVLVLVADLLAFSACGVGVSVLYFLTFFPPVAYRRRLHKAAEAVH
jgi:hypothetical protein